MAARKVVLTLKKVAPGAAAPAAPSTAVPAVSGVKRPHPDASTTGGVKLLARGPSVGKAALVDDDDRPALTPAPTRSAPIGGVPGDAVDDDAMPTSAAATADAQAPAGEDDLDAYLASLAASEQRGKGRRGGPAVKRARTDEATAGEPPIGGGVGVASRLFGQKVVTLEDLVGPQSSPSADGEPAAIGADAAAAAIAAARRAAAAAAAAVAGGGLPAEAAAAPHAHDAGAVATPPATAAAAAAAAGADTSSDHSMRGRPAAAAAPAPVVDDAEDEDEEKYRQAFLAALRGVPATVGVTEGTPAAATAADGTAAPATSSTGSSSSSGAGAVDSARAGTKGPRPAASAGLGGLMQRVGIRQAGVASGATSGAAAAVGGAGTSSSSSSSSSSSVAAAGSSSAVHSSASSTAGSSSLASGGEDFDEAISYDTGPPADPYAAAAAAAAGGGGAAAAAGGSSSSSSSGPPPTTVLVADADDEDAALFAGEEWQAGGKSALEQLQEKISRKELKPVDHAAMDYPPFRKTLYVESREVAEISPVAAAELRADGEIKIRGRGVPKPLWTWEQTGLPDRLLSVLETQGMKEPFAIQRQALPVVMSGRDVIGVAKTGSGKTLAYLLPMLRHILDQPPLAEGEGPVALILAPSRELVSQIYQAGRKFCKALGLTITPIYGGVSTGEQIAALKRGSHIIAATPGRLIDILTLNAGRVISLARVTFVVLDEADRMFDMGFEPQIARIVGNVRPDRQTLLFSATFPTHVEALARKILTNPVEIVVGGRSVASSDVKQWVELREEGDKFARLLQLLGEWYERGSVIVFVDTKEHCDTLYTDLMRSGYPSLSLHGGKDQVDRDQTLADFKQGVASILIATSVAGRGIDVKNCVLVINYSCPNHLEDYVHRVGRTGRAGRKGTAFTFITPQEGAYAADIMRALRDAKQGDHVPPQLTALAEEHRKKVEAGLAKKRASGYATRGYKFDANEVSATQAAKDFARRAFEVSSGMKDVSEIVGEIMDEEDEKRREEAAMEDARADAAADKGLMPAAEGAAAAAAGGAAAAAAATPTEESTAAPTATAGAAAATPLPALSGPQAAQQVALLRAKVASLTVAASRGVASAAADLEKAQAALATAEAAIAANARNVAVAAAAALSKQLGGAEAAEDGAAAGHFEEELEVNDYPPKARMRVMRRDNMGAIMDATRTAVMVKGVHVEPGKKPPTGERKLYLLIQGKEEYAVRKAKNEIRKQLEEETLRVGLAFDKGGASALGGMAGSGAGGGYAKFTI